VPRCWEGRRFVLGCSMRSISRRMFRLITSSGKLFYEQTGHIDHLRPRKVGSIKGNVVPALRILTYMRER